MRSVFGLSCACMLAWIGCGSDEPAGPAETTATQTQTPGASTTETSGLGSTGTSGGSTQTGGVTATTTTSTGGSDSPGATGGSGSTTGSGNAASPTNGVSPTTTTGATTTTTAGDAGATQDGATTGSGVEELEEFSFFVTSLEIMRELSGTQDGFGGDLGGLDGADDICQRAADAVGFGAKTWRAFLSVTDGGSGEPVHAIDRIGTGPWYDRNGRLVAPDVAGLLENDRPAGDAQTVEDLPNEFGQGLKQFGDTHDIVTGSNAEGQLNSEDPANTCNDWTSLEVTPTGSDEGGGGGPPGGFGGFGGFGGGVMLGHSWPARSGNSWIAAHGAHSCQAGVNLTQNGPGDGSSIGAGGGWGALYCFALQP